MKIVGLFPKAGLLILLGAQAAAQLAPAIQPPVNHEPAEFSGMVWKKQGNWHVNGSTSTLRLGEAMLPGSLVTAGNDKIDSLTVLMPDGQRLLFECSEAHACAQGFRIPEMIHRPTSVTWAMFVAVRNVLLLRPATDTAPFPTPVGRAETAGRFEIVAPIEANGQISTATALRDLPAGNYLLAVSRYGQSSDAVTRQPLLWKKLADRGLVKVEGPGLFRLQVTDASDVLRLDIEVLATPAATRYARSSGATANA